MEKESTSMEQPAHGTAHGGHDAPLSTLIFTALALLALTWCTVAVYWIDLGPWNLWIALGIASIKAVLVALFFMHLYYGKPFNALAFVIAVGFVLLFVSFTLVDSARYQPYVDDPASSTYAPKIEEQRQRE